MLESRMPEGYIICQAGNGYAWDDGYEHGEVCSRRTDAMRSAIRHHRYAVKSSGILIEGVTFEPLENVRALPCMAGVIDYHGGLERDVYSRFTSRSVLPVSRRLASAGGRRFIVVNHDGQPCAMLPDEASALDLPELEDWVPGGLLKGYDRLNPHLGL